MNRNSWQQVAITTQAGSYAGRPYAFQKAHTRGEKEKEKNRKAKPILSALCTLISGTTLHTKLRAIHPGKGAPCPSSPLHLQGTPLRQGGAPLYLQIRHVSVALLRAGVVRQLHVPEAGELIHEEGVLLDDGVENVLGEKSQRHSQKGQVGCAADAGAVGLAPPGCLRVPRGPPAWNSGWLTPRGPSPGLFISRNQAVRSGRRCGECPALPWSSWVLLASSRTTRQAPFPSQLACDK